MTSHAYNINQYRQVESFAEYYRSALLAAGFEADAKRFEGLHVRSREMALTILSILKHDDPTHPDVLEARFCAIRGIYNALKTCFDKAS